MHLRSRQMSASVCLSAAQSVRIFCALGILLACVAPAARAQDLGALARQERTRKISEPKKSPHVYTNEDVKKSQILTPEDKQRFTAERQNATPPLVNAPQEIVASQSAPKTESLGEIARRFRQEKLARETQAVLGFTTTPSPNPVVPSSGMPSSDQSTAATTPAVQRAQEIPLGDVARQYRRQQQAAENLKPPSNFPLPTDAAPLASPLPVERRVSPTSLHPVYTNASPEPRHELSRRELTRPEVTRRVASSASDETVLVRKGDSLWKLSWLYLGAGARWGELLAANAWIRDPNRVAEGRKLRLPTNVAPSGSAATLHVQSGDTLSKIAEFEFGRASAWTCVAHANPHVRDANRIFPGEMLNLPQACGSPLTSATAQGMISVRAASAGAWSNR
jgi:nucleoid-associated protein YgaU